MKGLGDLRLQTWIFAPIPIPSKRFPNLYECSGFHRSDLYK